MCSGSGMSDASGGGASAPNVVLTGCVDQVGRKSEATLAIASRHFEIGAFPSAAADQFELPRGRPTPGTGKGVAGRTLTPPAGDGGRRLAEIGRLCEPPPAADGNAEGS